MRNNPLLKLESFGQSIWLDYLRRGLITSGELKQLIEEDGLKGVTSNPSIFEKAIGGSHDYDEAIRRLAQAGYSAAEIYQTLTVEDIQQATDLFRPLYDRLDGADGFVSLEVSPHLARDTEGTIAEARRLWAAVDRPNLFIKVPGTPEGLPAIQQLISEGINVNVTLLFGVPRYGQVAAAYLTGLEMRLKQGKSIEHLASVASFFLSRIDVLVDPMLEEKMKNGGKEAKLAQELHGQVAIASAKTAYQIYKSIYDSERFHTLAEHGARPQRLLWASTSTKNPVYSDIKYVEALIGPTTVNTVPQETLDAYRDHGQPEARLEQGMEKAQELLQHLSDLGIDLDAVTQQLEEEGIEKFNKPFDKLMQTLREERAAALAEPVDQQHLDLADYDTAVRQRMVKLETEQFHTRLWRKDPSLWSTDSQDQQLIRNALGWLHVAEKMEENLPGLLDFAGDIRQAGFRQVVHLGMGGSSLAPLVFQRTFEPGEAGLPLTVIDTTDPTTILKVEQEIPLTKTLFIVASKSGTTAETRALADYFYKQLYVHKQERAGENFIAITDPETPLANLARQRNFRRVFVNFPDIGGRYSALSYFGLVPASLMGINVTELLSRARRMAHACASCVPLEENPGLSLGAAMGELAHHGRDKVTFLVPEPIATLGMWLEQLLAESTGKDGTGLLPVAGESIGDPVVYGNDRLFVYIRLKDEVDQNLEQGVNRLRQAGQPVVTIQMADRLDLGQEFFRWEIATATAGAILDINPFDQPNVQESKDNTNRLLDKVKTEGGLPEENPILRAGSLWLYAQEAAPTLEESLERFLSWAHSSEFIAVMAYLTESRATEQVLEAIRLRLRDGLHVATTLGYGPRFLHSTGQFHKGGSNIGLFLQLTTDDTVDIKVPDQPYTFSIFKRAQALGDLEALRRHSRRVIRVHLTGDVGAGLARLQQAIETVLEEAAEVAKVNN
jgi:transaldolase/glucose-6-phosphate isomerase